MFAAYALTLLINAPAPEAGKGADWPQWRGPNRDGKSLEKEIKWAKDGPPLAWKNEDIGTGYGSPAVVGDRLYVIGAKANAAGSPEFLQCLSLKDGKELWKQDLGTSAGKFSDSWGGGPRSTPTVHDDSIYCLGGTGDLVCCAKADGKKIWSKNLVRDFGGAIPSWGYAESPLIDDGKVLVCPGKSSGMIALDAKTGKTAWQCKEITDGAGYYSIIPMMLGGKKIYVQQSMKSAFGVFPDGKLAFKAGGIPRSTAVIPTPVIDGDFVFYTAGYGAGCESFKLALDGDKVNADKVFTGKFMSNHHGGVIGIGDLIYGHSDAAGWVCMTFKDDKAAPLWENKKFGKGSIAYADGHFVCYQEKDGEVAVIKASKESWDEVARFKIPKQSTTRPGKGKVWPHPVIAQGKLFLRDFELLYAFDLKK